MAICTKFHLTKFQVSGENTHYTLSLAAPPCSRPLRLQTHRHGPAAGPFCPLSQSARPRRRQRTGRRGGRRKLGPGSSPPARGGSCRGGQRQYRSEPLSQLHPCTCNSRCAQNANTMIWLRHCFWGVNAGMVRATPVAVLGVPLLPHFERVVFWQLLELGHHLQQQQNPPSQPDVPDKSKHGHNTAPAKGSEQVRGGSLRGKAASGSAAVHRT